MPLTFLKNLFSGPTPPTSNQPYFDFHAHPSLKSSLCTKDNQSLWKPIILKRNVIGNMFGKILNSQSDFTKIDANVKTITLVPLHAMEKAFSERMIFMKIAPMVSDLDPDIMRDARAGRLSYLNLMNNDLATLKTGVAERPGDKFTFITKGDELTDALQNREHIIIPAVEGGHSFKDLHHKLEDEDLDANEITEVVENYKKFITEIKPFYLTLTHLSRQQTATHAYGVRAKVKGVVILGGDHSFMPSKSGLHELGIKLMEVSYANGILIDLKHMSLLARQEFYQYRKDHSITLPIVATHMGIGGQSWNKIPVHALGNPDKPNGITAHAPGIPPGYMNTKFNPWTISLFDEDIEEILASGGLIGISLDRRIVGAGPVFNEFFSTEEYRKIMSHFNEGPVPPGYFLNLSDTLETGEEYFNIAEHMLDEDDEFRLNENKDDVVYLANNILHVFKVALNSKVLSDVQKQQIYDQLCLGSDLDGIIDPIVIKRASNKKNDVRVDSSSLITLEARLSKIMATIISDHKEDFPQLQNFNTSDWCRKFFYENGKNFLLKWYK